MSVLDLFIILVAVLISLALHFPTAYIVVGTLIVLIVVRLVLGERVPFRKAP